MSHPIKRLHTNSKMSLAVVHGGVAYLSGQVALDSRDRDATIQTREVLKRIDALLAEAGSSRGRLISATLWLADLVDYDAVNAEWEAWLPAECAPTRATVGAALALPGLLVEIAVIAAVD